VREKKQTSGCGSMREVGYFRRWERWAARAPRFKKNFGPGDAVVASFPNNFGLRAQLSPRFQKILGRACSLCRVSSTRALGKSNGRELPFCCWRLFAECPALGKLNLCRVSGTRQNIVCRVFCFTECGTRQRLDLLSARYIALGKDFCPRQRLSLR
jgi:hypothetical protein